MLDCKLFLVATSGEQGGKTHRMGYFVCNFEISIEQKGFQKKNNSHFLGGGLCKKNNNPQINTNDTRHSSFLGRKMRLEYISILDDLSTVFGAFPRQEMLGWKKGIVGECEASGMRFHGTEDFPVIAAHLQYRYSKLIHGK